MERKQVNILETDVDGAIADNGMYYTWGQIELDADDPNIGYILPPQPPKLIKFKCKPTYNFQSVEFEIELADNNLEPMFVLYRRIVEGLIKVSPDQPKNGTTSQPASAKQIEIMDKFHIQYQPGISYEQADAKIKESYAKAKSRAY